MSSIRWIEAATFGSNNDIPPRAHHTSSIVGSFMYIIGGTSGSTFFNDVRVIDLKGADHDWSIPRLIRTMGTSEINDVQMQGTSSFFISFLFVIVFSVIIAFKQTQTVNTNTLTLKLIFLFFLFSLAFLSFSLLFSFISLLFDP